MSNPIQQAIEGLEWIQLVFTDDTVAQERDPELWLPRLNEALSALQSLQGVELPKFPLHDVAATAPSVVWLNIFGVESDYESGFPEDHEGITWCDSEVGDLDVPYVRVDRVAAVAAAMARGAVPQGWKLMPKDATEEILDALLSVVDLTQGDPEDPRYDEGRSTASEIYRAMLAAAPTPEATQPTQAITRQTKYGEATAHFPVLPACPMCKSHTAGECSEKGCGYMATQPTQAEAPSERLHTFLNAAAGEGLVLDGVDAADLYVEIFPERYAKAIANLDAGVVDPTIQTMIADMNGEIEG